MANRGHDSIAVFAVDATTGALSLQSCTPCGGATPRDISIVGDFMLVACQDDSKVTSLRIGADGALTPAGEIAVPTPSVVCPLP